MQVFLLKKAIKLMTFLRIFGARDENRTHTGLPIRPSNVRVYQFRHSRSLNNNRGELIQLQEYLLFFFRFLVENAFSSEIIKHQTDERFDTEGNKICPKDGETKETDSVTSN